VTKTAKKKPASREGVLLAELCSKFNYTFADTLPAKDRSTMLMSKAAGSKKAKLEPAVSVRLVVPAAGTLGKMVMELRKKNPGRTPRSRTK
jgi:hypothetical protein